MQQHELDKLKNQNSDGQPQKRKATEKGKAYRMSLLDDRSKLLTKIIRQFCEINELFLSHPKYTAVKKQMLLFDDVSNDS